MWEVWGAVQRRAMGLRSYNSYQVHFFLHFTAIVTALLCVIVTTMGTHAGTSGHN